MYRGFKVYEETFYVILKRYDQLETGPTTENERLNLLNKIRSLAGCLQDEFIKYDFTSKLINERSNKIIQVLDDIKINYSKNMYIYMYNIVMKIISKRIQEWLLIY